MIGSVFQRVVDAPGLPRQLAFFPNWDEAGMQSLGHQCAKNKATCIDPDDFIHLGEPRELDHPINGLLQERCVCEHWGDVFEEDAWLWEIRAHHEWWRSEFVGRRHPSLRNWGIRLPFHTQRHLQSRKLACKDTAPFSQTPPIPPSMDTDALLLLLATLACVGGVVHAVAGAAGGKLEKQPPALATADAGRFCC
jgi:hypothetical protein